MCMTRGIQQYIHVISWYLQSYNFVSLRGLWNILIPIGQARSKSQCVAMGKVQINAIV